MTMKASRWDDAAVDSAARIIDAMPSVVTPQRWVDLLKAPTCLGPMREACVRQLARSLRRPIAGVWQLADRARAGEAGIDLLTPPTRP